jgi:hypothetical protein
MTESVEDIVFAMEDSIFQATSLAYALMVMSSSDELRGKPGEAVWAVTNSLLKCLEGIKGTREAALRAAKSERTTVRKRGLRVVDTDDDGGAA